MSKLLRFCLLSSLLASSAAALAQQWTTPTAEELSMTSIPEVPGAPAVILYKEQTAEDALHMWSYYFRIKVLTEGGKDYANVDLPYIAGSNGWSIDSISGRTVHPDGSITLFAGKPYDKLIEKAGGIKVNAVVFSLPNVEVGSILEYRYKLRYDDFHFTSPDWYVQTDLFLRKGHYSWRPTNHELQSDMESGITNVAWTPILPPGPAVRQSNKGGVNTIELDVENIKPLPVESNMPPMNSFSYRVMFYYTGYRTSDEYWKNAGKYWSNARNKFIDPGSATKAQVKQLVQPGDTDEQKVQKIYAFMGTLDNTVFTRSHTSSEDRAQGFKDINNADDILKRKRGNDDQLTELFVSMVRAAGMKAYLMGVADRDRRIFLPSYLTLGQLDDYIAIVPLNGKDVYFDPGQRFCPFGQLSWRHSMAGGVRQVEGGGTALSNTPGESYKDAHVTRIADLKLDEHGSATGTVTVSLTGDPALRWRQEALRGDDTSLNKDLRTDMENTLPGGMEVRVTKVENLSDQAQPLKVTYEVSGGIGSPTGKRLLVPASLFEVNEKPTFTAQKRDMPVDMHYASYVQDAVRLKLPPSLVIESAPTDGKEQLTNTASYTSSAIKAPDSITLRRNLILGRTIYGPDEYTDLRTFYGKMQARDQESLVLTRASAVSSATPQTVP